MSECEHFCPECQARDLELLQLREERDESTPPAECTSGRMIVDCQCPTCAFIRQQREAASTPPAEARTQAELHIKDGDAAFCGKKLPEYAFHENPRIARWRYGTSGGRIGACQACKVSARDRGWRV